MSFDPLSREFFHRDTLVVARDLLGNLIVRVLGNRQLVVRVVEVEAYKGLSDPASHAYGGNKGRASVMYGEVGRAYVYFTYGNHFCMNVVARSPRSKAGAVLFRAGEPLDGIEIMMRNRGTSEPRLLTSGPGRLTRALMIDRSFYGVDLTMRGELFLARGALRANERVAVSTRVGITRAKERPWRFFIKDNRFVST